MLFSCGWYWDQYCLTSSLMTQRVGQNVPSGILQLIQDWEELLIHQMVVLPFRGTLTDWELDTCTALVQMWHEKVMPYFPNGHLLNWHCIVLGIYCLQLTAQEVNGGGGGQIILHEEFMSYIVLIQNICKNASNFIYLCLTSSLDLAEIQHRNQHREDFLLVCKF